MSVFVVRNKMSGNFLVSPGTCVCLEDFKHAHQFTSEEDARREANQYPTWREVVHVTWSLVWHVGGARDVHDPYYSDRKTFGPWTSSKLDWKRFDSKEEAAAVIGGKIKGWRGEPGWGARIVRRMRVVKP